MSVMHVWCSVVEVMPKKDTPDGVLGSNVGLFSDIDFIGFFPQGYSGNG